MNFAHRFRNWFSRTRLDVWLRNRRERARSRAIQSRARETRREYQGYLDRAVSWAFPGQGAKRLAARVEMRRAEIVLAQTDRLVGFDEARPSPRAPKIEASGASADWSLELGHDRRIEADRARGLERNNALARLLLDRSVQHTVGEGLQLKCKTKDDGWNEAAQALWEDYTQKENCDARGRSSLHELVGLHYRGCRRDGDGGFVLETDGKLRPFESDELASPNGGYMTPSDTDGVELNRRGVIIAYHLFDYDPTVLWPDRRRAISRLSRISAENVLFQARRSRLNQTRGMSDFNGLHEMLEQLSDAIEAVAVAHVMGASFGVYIKKKAPIGFGYGQDSSAPNRPDIEFEPGMTVRLDPDEEIGQINPTQPGPNFEILLMNLMRICAAVFGEVLDFVNFDFTKANYSNLRAASIESALITRIEQHRFVRECYRQVWAWRLARAIKNGELTARRDCFKHVWGVPGRPWADPEVEIRAAMASIDAGLDTRRSILARRGMDFDEVAIELGKERKFMDKQGLADIRGILTRDAIVPQTEAPKKKPGAKNGAKNRTKGRLSALPW